MCLDKWFLDFLERQSEFENVGQYSFIRLHIWNIVCYKRRIFHTVYKIYAGVRR